MYLSTAFPSFSPFFASFNILPPAPEKSPQRFLDGAGGAFSEAFSGFPYSSVRLLVPPSRLFHDNSSVFWSFGGLLMAVCARHGQNERSQALAVARILSAMPRLP